jgi:hypothetical protein
LGTVAALALVSGAYGKGWLNLKSGPARIVSDIGSLAHDRAQFTAVAKTRWASWRFASYPQWPAVRALQQEPSIKAGGRFWVLGDAAPIAFLAHNRWPYYFTEFYDGSPITYQRKVLDQLAQMPPARVIFDFRPYEMYSDAVPHVVRVPLLYDWAVRHLEPERTIGDWAIMRPRKAGEPVALPWWRRRIGSTIDLGLIPQDIHFRSELCVAGPTCRTYIVVTPIAGTPQPANFVVPVKVGGLDFFVRLETNPHVHRYVVDLSRAWFWSAAPATAARSIETQQTTGASVTVTKRLQSADVLY